MKTIRSAGFIVNVCLPMTKKPRNISQIIARRVYLLSLVCITLFLGIVGRLFFLQVRHAAQLQERARRACTRTLTLDSSRGVVVDCNGILLAANKALFDVYWNGSGCHASSIVRERIARIVAIIGGDLSALRVCRAEATGARLCLARDISLAQVQQLCEIAAGCDSLSVEVRSERVYPQGALAAHVIGYQGRCTVNRSGIERWCDEMLGGRDGLAECRASAAGRRFGCQILEEPQPGMTLRLTLDARLQRKAESLFSADQAGALIVLDPQSGALRVVASCPGFDPNILAHPMSTETWQAIVQGNAPLMNRAFHALYPPASIFKLVTFSAGLETGVMPPEGSTMCEGYTTLGGRRFYCIRRWGHGVVPNQFALAISCNIPCYEIARALSIDDLALYANKFGLGCATGCVLADVSGLIPTREWKEITKGIPWWPGETLSASIGQSYMLVTPLQVARLIGSIATGNLVRPRLLEREEILREPLEIAASTREFLRESMRISALRGTARALRGIKDCEVWAKTGTAQLESLKYDRDYAPEHGWLGCFFSIRGGLPLVLVVLVERAGSARPAIAIAREFLSWYAAHEHAH